MNPVLNTQGAFTKEGVSELKLLSKKRSELPSQDIWATWIAICVIPQKLMEPTVLCYPKHIYMGGNPTE